MGGDGHLTFCQQWVGGADALNFGSQREAGFSHAEEEKKNGGTGVEEHDMLARGDDGRGTAFAAGGQGNEFRKTFVGVGT